MSRKPFTSPEAKLLFQDNIVSLATDRAVGTPVYCDAYFTPNIAELHSGLIPVLPLAKVYLLKLLMLHCGEIDKISQLEEKDQF